MRLTRSGPHRDRGAIGIVQEVGFRVVLVRFDAGDRNGSHLDLVDSGDLERSSGPDPLDLTR